HSALDAGLDAPGSRHPGAADDARQSASCTRSLILLLDRLNTRFEIERAILEKVDRPPAHPGEIACDVLELKQKADRRGSAADHDNTLAAEVFGRSVLVGVNVFALERLETRVPGNEWSTPSAGGVDNRLGRRFLLLIVE